MWVGTNPEGGIGGALGPGCIGRWCLRAPDYVNRKRFRARDKPDYAKMSAEVSNENDDELKSLPIAAIDCDAETTTCAKYGITGYPTTRFFKSSDAHHKGVETHLRQPAVLK